MPLYNTVKYASSLENPSWTDLANLADSIAHVCQTPARWLTNGKQYIIRINNKKLSICEIVGENFTLTPTQRVIRTVIGLLFAIPGQAIAIPLMFLATYKEEYALKQKFVTGLTQEEKEKLKELIDERKKVSDSRQGCDPVTCSIFLMTSFLCSIVCMMCQMMPGRQHHAH